VLVVEGVLILRADLDLAFDGLDYRNREVDAGEARAAAEVAGREDIHLKNLVTDDVDADEEHAVSHELGADHLGNLELAFADLDGLRLAAGMNVGADIVGRSDAAESAVLVADSQRLAVH
jgi:hypothetical protein